MSKVFRLGEDQLTCKMVLDLAAGKLDITVSSDARARIIQSQKDVEAIARGSKAVYGINTGFGPLCNTRISADETSLLQRNLLLSHSVGTGKAISPLLAKIMMILKTHTLCKGFSGVHIDVIDRLIWHIREDLIPLVPAQGSVGASGDLAPLAHMSLPLIGEGKLFFEGKYEPAGPVLQKRGKAPLTLGPKDGLALINGTQFITAHACLLLDYFYKNLRHASLTSAMLLDALEGSLMPFHADLHKLRPYAGNTYVAAEISNLLKDSEILESHTNCAKVQDPYSLRCIPQVHGASWSAWLHLKDALTIELNSVTDNPVVFNADFTISGGNFHGQSLALPIDYAGLALSELGNITDRRIYLALEGKSGNLPQLLMKDTGLNSGFMILQYTSAALASENKTLCFPASADSIMTALGQEDHVSMGSIGARKALKIARNTQTIIAIELICAAQALDFKRPLHSGKIIEEVHTYTRKFIPFASKDDFFGNYIEKSIKILESGNLLNIEQNRLHDRFENFNKAFEIY